MKTTLHLACLCLFTYVSPAFSQGEIPVDLHAGTPVISLPLASIASQDVGDNVSMTYNAKGVSVNSPNGYYGVGWNLQAGGRISREVRGLPDDYNTATRHGWLHSQSNVSTGALPGTADLSHTTCSDEHADYNAIHSWNYSLDTEPDLFHYTIPGHSGSFVFDNSITPVIKLIPYDDIKIQYTLDTSLRIATFTITTSNGITYAFNLSSEETGSAVLSAVAPSTIDFLKTEYEQNRLTIVYNYEWVLTQVTSPAGAFLKYTYINQAYANKIDYQPDRTVVVTLKNNGPAGYTARHLFSRQSGTNVKKLVRIESSASQRIEIAYTDSTDAEKKVLTSIKLYDLRRQSNDTPVKEMVMTYDMVPCTINCSAPGADDDPGYVDYSDYKRMYLTSITELSECSTMTLYRFGYKDRELLPLPNSLDMDFWGYFNGRGNVRRTPAIYVYPQLAPHERYRVFPIANYSGEKYVMEGADLTVNPNTVQAGVLDHIWYASGAKTVFTFEPNEFYDAVAGQSYYGGGLRIKSITTEDGVNPAGTIVRNFEYKDDTGKSSGKILYKPSYTIPLYQYVDPASSYTANYNALVQSGRNPWLYLVARVDVDLSARSTGNVIGYEKVTTRTSGMGYTKYEYQIPSAWGNGAFGEWTPSENKFARSPVCPSMDFITSGDAWTFPFTRNPDYGYANGLLRKKYEYSEQNVLMRETSITYQHLYANTAASEKVWGVTYHKMPYTNDVYLFSKYFLLSNATKVTATESVITYDAASAAKNLTESVQYFHESPHHRLVTRTRKTESDGAVYQTYRRYPLDYGTVPGGADKASEMIGKLQTSFRNGTPVEVYSSMTRDGQAEKFLSGSVVRFGDLGTQSVLPLQQLQLSGVPLNSYTPSYIDPSTKTFVVDPHYDIVATTLAYTGFERPLSVTGKSRMPVSTSWGHSYTLPVAEITNAAYDQFAFSDFESSSDNEFAVTNGSPVKRIGRTGFYGVYADALLRRTITKGGDIYTFAGWIKRTDVPVAITLRIKNTSGVIDHQQTYNFSPGGGYEYFEFQVPVNAALTQFIAEVQGSFAATANKPALDDISLYPSHAELVSYTYAIPYGAASVSSRSQTSYSLYGSFGRLKEVRDTDGNILRHYDYHVPGETTEAVFSAAFTAPSHAVKNKSVFFRAYEHCMDNVTYEWDFGVGSGFQPGERDQAYTYTEPGSWLVKLRVSHPHYGTQTSSATVIVQQ